MKNSILKALIVLLGLGIPFNAISQTAKKKTSTTPAKSTTSKTEPVKQSPAAGEKAVSASEGTAVVATTQDEPALLAKHSAAVQKIFKSDKGVFRGFNFGTSIDVVKKTEGAQYVADGKDFAIFKLTVNDKEEVEILYYLDEKKNIKGFGIEFPVHISKKDETDLIEDLQKYFNERYGKFTVNDKNDEVWNSKDGSYSVEMGDSSESADMLEIEVDIFKK
jgi:hypothetical protein